MIIESDVKHFSTRYVVGKYRISSIHFFDKNGIVCETDWGYLEHYENYICQRIPSFEIKNQDTIKLKRKLDFNTKEAFLFESKRDWDNALTTKLYIPFIKEDWEIISIHTPARGVTAKRSRPAPGPLPDGGLNRIYWYSIRRLINVISRQKPRV